MAVAQTAPVYTDEVAGEARPLLLTNREIDRFEVQYAPFGVFGLWAQLLGDSGEPQVRHVRDIIALGLIGGGMADKEADATVASVPTTGNLHLRAVARRLLAVTFIEDFMAKAAGLAGDGDEEPPEKKLDGSAPDGKSRRRSATARGRGSKTSAA